MNLQARMGVAPWRGFARPTGRINALGSPPVLTRLSLFVGSTALHSRFDETRRHVPPSGRPHARNRRIQLLKRPRLVTQDPCFAYSNKVLYTRLMCHVTRFLTMYILVCMCGMYAFVCMCIYMYMKQPSN